MSEEIHRGQLVKKAVSDGVFKISEIARKTSGSRKFINIMFHIEDFPLYRR